ncbi:hypothetical protein SSUA7_0508 [Streptococcus suis A7]|nr:hypothetical protein SSU05_0553 [Streptococcus suis 05ZYH33]ABP91712.1 hypothetical protein SSU98_0554 [Streptococcus suis 98HAH33]AER43836.1 hypothetical protein SSUA7_0508 [Streptococcus suis A7]
MTEQDIHDGYTLIHRIMKRTRENGGVYTNIINLRFYEAEQKAQRHFSEFVSTSQRSG